MKQTIELDAATEFGRRQAPLAARVSWWLATHRLFSSKTRHGLRRRIRGRHQGPYDVTVGGLNFRTYPAENYCDRVLFGAGRLPEMAERRLLQPVIRPGMNFVDVGANVGTYSLWVARLAGPSARILALEPHPRTFAKLRFNIEANLARNIVALDLGAGEESAVMQLYFDGGGNVGQSSMLAAGAGSAAKPQSARVEPLPDILAAEGFTGIDLLKIDVEGYEDRALLPLFTKGPAALWPAALLIETVQRNLWETDCIAFLAERGYREVGATGQNLLLLRN
jgi:FkbM family methyltransferase